MGGLGTAIDEILDHQIHDARIDAVQVLVDLTRSKADFIARKSNYMVGYQSSRNPLEFYRVFREINAAIAKFQPDVLHLHSSFAGAYVRLFRSGLSVPAPIVYCAHGWSFDQERGALKRLTYRLAERVLSRRTDGIVNISRHEAEMARRAGVLAPVQAIAHPQVRAAQSTGNRPLEVEAGCINLLYVGRIDHKKGADLLPRIVEILGRGDIVIHVIGEPTRDGVTIEASRQLRAIGWIDGGQIDDYYQCADAVIVPSRSEAFGLVVLEAMRNGKPVIVSNRGSLPELVIHGYNGFIFDLDNIASLRPMFKSVTKKDLARMGGNARAIFESSFSGTHPYDRIVEVYRAVIARKSSR